MNFALPPAQEQAPQLPLHQFVSHMERTHDHLRSEMRLAQDKQQQFSNASRNPAPRLVVGSLVWLSTRNMKTALPSKKFDHKRLRPYPSCEVVGSEACPLTLPPSMKIHTVFHVSLS